MQCQMIWTWKATIAMTAFKWLSTGVFSIVTCKLITARKSPFTTFPWTLVRFFAWKNKQKNRVKILMIKSNQIRNRIKNGNCYWSAVPLIYYGWWNENSSSTSPNKIEMFMLSYTKNEVQPLRSYFMIIHCKFQPN